MNAKELTVTIKLPIKYKAVMSGMNVLILDASIKDTYYPVTVLPEDVRAQVLNAITEAVRIEDYESRFRRSEEDGMRAVMPAGLSS